MLQLSDEIAKLQLVAGLTKSAQVLQLSRLMVRSEAKEDRMNLLSVIMVSSSELMQPYQNGGKDSVRCLAKFLGNPFHR